MENLERIRSLGYAVDDEEMSLGVRCLAVPVYDYRNSVRYSIGVSGPKENINSASMGTYIKRMVETTRRLSAAIGCTR
jgi:DNA-binding IclR family transcriptional regulator